MMADHDLGELRDEVASMRVKQIKNELDTLGVQYADAFEKEDLVQRLIDARSGGAQSSPTKAPTTSQMMEGMELFMSDADGPAILEEMQKDPTLMQAAMDIAGNGDVSKYQDDPKVMEFMRKLEQITKRGMRE